MCLARLCKRNEKPFRRKLSKPEFTAWKVVERGRMGWIGAYCRYLYTPGEHRDNSTIWISDDNGTIYRTGFHCFLRRSDARRERKRLTFPPRRPVILKVRIKAEDVTSMGPDGPTYFPVVVATKMTVLGEVR